MMYVLIIITHLYGTGDVVSMQTFAAKSACDIALTWVSSNIKDRSNVKVTCVHYDDMGK